MYRATSKRIAFGPSAAADLSASSSTPKAASFAHSRCQTSGSLPEVAVKFSFGVQDVPVSWGRRHPEQSTRIQVIAPSVVL